MKFLCGLVSLMVIFTIAVVQGGCLADESERDVSVSSLGMMSVGGAAGSVKRFYNHSRLFGEQRKAQELVLRVKEVSRRVSLAYYDVALFPELVYYEVVRGGKLEDVANQFGVFHHRILALNPGLKLDSRLEAGHQVVVYRREGHSQSLGYPHAGSLRNGVPMVDGPGRILRSHRYRCWGSEVTVREIDYLLKQWSKYFPEKKRLFVGNLSAPNGGKLEQHKTHQNGMDVDISYPVKGKDEGEKERWVKADAQNFDCEGTWWFLKKLYERKSVHVVYIDYGLQKLLYECAENFGTESVFFRNLLQYPRGKSGQRFIRHSDGHEDHLHISFKCAKSDLGCRNG